MAVQQNKKSRSKSKMRRSHQKITAPALTMNSQTGQIQRRHHLGLDGSYRGKQYINVTSVAVDESE